MNSREHKDKTVECHNGLLAVAFVVSLACVVLSGCGTQSSSSGADASGSNAALTISPSSVTLQAGRDQIFTANMPVNWSASCGVIHNDGTYTAPATPGTCIVTATATNGSSKTASATVTVTPPPPPPGVTVTPNSVTLQTAQASSSPPMSW